MDAGRTGGAPRPIAGAQTGIYQSGNRVPKALGLDWPGGVWPVSAADWQERAAATLAPGPWAYLEGGAGSEDTMQANRLAFSRWRLRPRVLHDVTERDLTVDVLGFAMRAPLLLAPIGVQEVFHPDADLAAAQAAAAFGIPFVASTVSSVPMEAIAAVTGDSPHWFQLYPSKHRELTESFLSRAKSAGYGALVVTLDTMVLGWRERDLRLGYLPFLEGRGIANYLTDGVFRSLLTKTPEDDPAAAIGTFLALYSNPAMTWSDLSFIRARWPGPILLKGITHPDDARRALDHGVDGLVVSNHGGRQVDGAVAALDALPAVAKAVAGRLPLLMDSGIRSGSDVLKALALGAQAVLIGRLFLYGLAAAGEAGVERVLENLVSELDVTLALCGRRSIREVDGSLVVPGP